MSAKVTGVVVGKDGCEADKFNGDEILTVMVQNTARMDAPAITLGEQIINLKAGDGFPISFSVEYDAEAASGVPDYGFTLHAMIENHQGDRLYRSDTRTSANADKIEVRKL